MMKNNSRPFSSYTCNLWFMRRVIHLIDVVTKLYINKHHQLYSRASLHWVRVDSVQFWLRVPCWLWLRHITSCAMCSVFAPKLATKWLEHSDPIDMTQRHRDIDWSRKFQGLLDSNYTDTPVLNLFIKSTCCNTSLNHWQHLNTSDVPCLMTSKGQHQLY